MPMRGLAVTCCSTGSNPLRNAPYRRCPSSSGALGLHEESQDASQVLFATLGDTLLIWVFGAQALGKGFGEQPAGR